MDSMGRIAYCSIQILSAYSKDNRICFNIFMKIIITRCLQTKYLPMEALMENVVDKTAVGEKPCSKYKKTMLKLHKWISQINTI